MELRQDLIEKTMELFQAMEAVTGFHPGDQYYQDIIQSLDILNDKELSEKFIQITEIITRTIDQAANDVTQIKKECIKNEESADRTKELNEIASILNF